MASSTVTPVPAIPSKDPLGDSISRVELLNVMGDDLTVVNAARVSFHKESTEMCEQDQRLINYLAKHNHITPFFHPQLCFRIKMPIFVAREWFRHQIGFARNEVSRRQVDEAPEVYLPKHLRARDPKLKQGSKSEDIENNDAVVGLLKESLDSAVRTQNYLLDQNVAPEVARVALPQSMYTEFIETGSLSAQGRLCKLRLDPHAQKEIREQAEAVSQLIEKQFPVCWKALMADTAH